jgi:hypothetical protein
VHLSITRRVVELHCESHHEAPLSIRMSGVTMISGYDSPCSANLPSTETAPRRASRRASSSNSMNAGIALRNASRSSTIHLNERCRDDIGLRLTLFSKLAKCRGGGRSDIVVFISEKLEERLNGDVKSVTKLRCPSK